MSRFKLLWAFMIPLAGVLIGGCGATASTTNSTADSFPLSLSTAKGKVTISHRPARIVSLSPTATEDLYSVGAGQQVVAVDSYSTHPAEAPRTSLSGLTPNIEAVAGYHPDLVLVADDTNNLVSQLGKLHIPVLVEPPAADLGGVYAEISQIGQATGHSAQATTADSGIKQQVQTILRSVPARSAPLSVYHELDQTYYSATTHTFIGQIYKLLGLQNIADRAPGSNGYPQLSPEYIISANPDLIVLADTVCCSQSAATVKVRPGWSVIKAVQTGAVVPVNDDVASQWGPRIVVFVQAIADALKAMPNTTG